MTASPESRARTGADAFLEQLLAADVRWIFGNPGTTEQSVIDSLQDHDGIDLVLTLHEGVAVSAAEGYARATGNLGVVELHAGPGLGNGLGMLYNARYGHTPLLVYVGQCEQRTLYQEPVLSTDLVALASPLSKWAYEIRSVDEIPQVVRRALKVARTPPCGPVVLALPLDLADAPCSAPVMAPSYVPMTVRPDPQGIDDAASVILQANAPVVIAGDGVVAADAVDELSAVAHLVGAPILEGTLFEACAQPNEPLKAGRLPQDGAGALRLLEPYDVVIGVGSKLLAQIFPVEGQPLGERQVVHIGLDPWELGKNQTSTLVFGHERLALVDLSERLRERLDAQSLQTCGARRERVEEAIGQARRRSLERDRERWDLRPMSPERAVADLVSSLPDDVVLVDESLTAFGAVSRYFEARPGHWFRGRGGGIGTSLASAVGVQLARPSAKVVALVGDGSAMYSITALWTAAHRGLPITWVVLNNRSYRILKENTLERRRSDVASRAFVGADLTEPDLDFVAIASGMGVEAVRVTAPEEIPSAVAKAMSSSGPTLIEVLISGDFERNESGGTNR